MQINAKSKDSSISSRGNSDSTQISKLLKGILETKELGEGIRSFLHATLTESKNDIPTNKEKGKMGVGSHRKNSPLGLASVLWL